MTNDPGLDNLNLWEHISEPPKKALKPIRGGRLNGFTDISPIWRYKKLTEIFGRCGEGWYTSDESYTTIDGAEGEVIVICRLKLYVKNPVNGEWSFGINGQGGSKLIAMEKNGLRSDDEAFKKAYTDAVSVACKQLGMGANVYWEQGGDSKFNTLTDEESTPKPAQRSNSEAGTNCEKCGAKMTGGQISLSKNKFGRLLCPNCQTKEGNQ